MKTQPVKRSARVRLLDAADELFFLNSITSTGVDNVLTRAEVSVATLYAQFGSKDGLLQACLERRLETWKTHWATAIAAADSDQDRLLALFDALRLYRENLHNARWCAFLSAAVENPYPDHPATKLLKADTSLLNERLLHLSEQIVGADAGELAAAILLIYNGTLASLLRGSPSAAIALGRDTARFIVRAHTK